MSKSTIVRAEKPTPPAPRKRLTDGKVQDTCGIDPRFHPEIAISYRAFDRACTEFWAKRNMSAADPADAAGTSTSGGMGHVASISPPQRRREALAALRRERALDRAVDAILRDQADEPTQTRNSRTWGCAWQANLPSGDDGDNDDDDNADTTRVDFGGFS